MFVSQIKSARTAALEVKCLVLAPSTLLQNIQTERPWVKETVEQLARNLARTEGGVLAGAAQSSSVFPRVAWEWSSDKRLDAKTEDVQSGKTKIWTHPLLFFIPQYWVMSHCDSGAANWPHPLIYVWKYKNADKAAVICFFQLLHSRCSRWERLKTVKSEFDFQWIYQRNQPHSKELLMCFAVLHHMDTSWNLSNESCWIQSITSSLAFDSVHIDHCPERPPFSLLIASIDTLFSFFTATECKGSVKRCWRYSVLSFVARQLHRSWSTILKSHGREYEYGLINILLEERGGVTARV